MGVRDKTLPMVVAVGATEKEGRVLCRQGNTRPDAVTGCTLWLRGMCGLWPGLPQKKHQDSSRTQRRLWLLACLLTTPQQPSQMS